MLQSYLFLSTPASIKTIFIVGFSLFCHATLPIRTFALRAFLNIIFSARARKKGRTIFGKRCGAQYKLRFMALSPYIGG